MREEYDFADRRKLHVGDEFKATCSLSEIF